MPDPRPPDPRPPADEVDRLVDAWRRERPDLDVSPLEILSRVSRLARRLELARRAAFADFDLDLWEFDVLAALRRSGEPYAMSPGQLTASMLVTSGTMTNRIDRLEQRGLVARQPDLSDRRGVRVVLTDEGRQRVDGALTDLLERERILLGSLTAAAREQLATLLRRIARELDSPT